MNTSDMHYISAYLPCVALITYVETDSHPSVTSPVDWLPSMTDNKVHTHTHTQYSSSKRLFNKRTPSQSVKANPIKTISVFFTIYEFT